MAPIGGKNNQCHFGDLRGFKGSFFRGTQYMYRLSGQGKNPTRAMVRWHWLEWRPWGLCMKIVFVFWDGDYLWKLLTYSDFGKVQAWRCSAFFTTTDLSLNFDLENTCLSIFAVQFRLLLFQNHFFLKKQRAPYSWTLLCK